MTLLLKKKVSSRRQQVRDNMASERFARLASLINGPYPRAIVILWMFIAAVTLTLGLDLREQTFYMEGLTSLKPWPQVVSLLVIVTAISTAMSLYLLHYRPGLLNKGTRLIALAVLFWLLLAITRAFSLNEDWKPMAAGTAVGGAIILTIAYDQRFAVGMIMFYIMLAVFAVDQIASVELLLVMAAGALSCCFSLREIRTRKKLIEVSLLAAITVFLTAMALGIIQDQPVKEYILHAGIASAAAFVVGIFIQAFLPIIESAFGIATSMTLMDYSDANQPLLRKLAMDAPGTFSHSLLIGSMAEAAAEAIRANGLLCRVGSYYHDIGKIHKPSYFVENQMGSISRHEQLSPAMSQLIIAGHVKDGIEIAKEFGLPTVLREFIESHHGTTLMEYFYHEAKKRQDDRQSPVSESEFRYPGPKPHSKEAAIVMLADAAESAARSLADLTPAKVEALVHTIAMRRLQDGQFDECDLTLRELSLIEASLSKSLAAHHHGRIAYPKIEEKPKTNGNSAFAGSANGSYPESEIERQENLDDLI
jgi:hypothetical protein